MEEQKKKKEEKEIEKLKAEIEKLKKEKEKYLDLAKRAQAEFLNYKKEEKERVKIEAKTLLKDFAKEKLFPLLDSLCYAERFYRESLKEGLEGILNLKKELLKILESIEIKKIDVGKEFDPHFHEAVEEVSREGFKKGEIIEEVLPGFLDQETKKVLRPAKVKVAK